MLFWCFIENHDSVEAGEDKLLLNPCVFSFRGALERFLCNTKFKELLETPVWSMMRYKDSLILVVILDLFLSVFAVSI